MSEGCQTDSDRCSQVKRTIVAAGVVAIAALLVALLVVLMPVARGWKSSMDERDKRITLAAVHTTNGDTAFAEGRFEDAAMDYMIASNLNPADIDLANLVSRAKVAGIAANPTLIDSIDLVATRNEVARVAAVFPTDVTNINVVKALMKFREGAVTEAVALLDAAQTADPTAASVHFANAVLWQFVPDRVEKIGAEYDAVLAAKPDDPRIQGIAGQYFLSSSTPEKGITLLRSASAKISNVEWLKVLVQFALQSGDVDTAKADIQVAMALAPRDADVLSLLGQVLINANDFQNAVGVLKQAASIKETRDTLFRLGLAYNALRRFDLALPALSKANQMGSDIMSMFEYGNALLGIGNFDEARKVFDIILGAPDGDGQSVESKVTAAIKEKVRQAMASMSAARPAGR